jgi:putative sigma-54 modulation protein
MPKTSQPLRISGKNLDIGEALRARIAERMAEALGKYVEGGYSGHVTVEKEGFGFRTECALHLDSGPTLQAESLAGDAYASAQGVAERIEKRLRRHAHRLKDRATSRVRRPQAEPASYYVLETPDFDEAQNEELPAEAAPVVIAESTRSVAELSVSEAVGELDLTGAPVVVFRHAGSGRINIVYRRADGHVGWIDPPTATGGAGH